MSIYEAIGIGWVVFATAVTTVETLYLAYRGLQTQLNQRAEFADRIPGVMRVMSQQRD